MKGWIRFFLEKIIMKIPEKKIIGCQTCEVGVFYGLQVSGFYEAYCRSALLGLDDNLHYKTRYVHLKKGENYPDWCPIYGKIKKEEVS